MAKQIFVSWSRETEPVARALGAWLQASFAGAKVFVSGSSIEPGSDWMDDLHSAAAAGDCAVLCLGPSALVSPWVMYEVGAIGLRRSIVPVLLHVAPRDLPAPVRGKQAVSAFDAEGAVAKGLTGALQRGVARALGSQAEPAEAEPLLQALKEFDASRRARLRRIVEHSGERKRILAMLRKLERKSYRPKSLVTSERLRESFKGRHRTALALLYLVEQRLVRLERFDSLKSGTAVLTDDGRRALEGLAGEPTRSR